MSPHIDSSPVLGRQPRVVQVVLTLAPGGTERAVVDLVTRSEGRVRNLVCCLDRPGDWAERVTRLGVPLVALGRSPGFHPSLGWRLARVAEDHGANLLHCHQYSPFVYGQIARLVRPSLKLVFTEQGRLSDAPPSRKRTVTNWLLGHLAGQMYAVSADLRRFMVAEGFPDHRLGVIPNGVEAGPRPSDAARRAARLQLRVEESEFVVGTAARFDPVKSLVTLVDAFAAIVHGVPGAKLVMIGDGPERSALEAQVEARQLSRMVRFTGMRSDVRSLLPGLDAYINCSLSEGTSLTIMEAMAAAVPVVATRVGGNPEVVAEGETGLLVPAGQPLALAEAVLVLAADRLMAARLGQAGRERMERDFNVDRVVDRYLGIYLDNDA